MVRQQNGGIKVTLTKLGPHVQRPATVEAIRWIRRAPAIKIMDHPSGFDHCPPGALKFFRVYVSSGDQFNITPRQYFDLARDRSGGRKDIILLTRNEHQSKISDGLLDRIPWDKEFVKLADWNSYKEGVAGGNDADGTMEEPEVQALALNGFCGFRYWITHAYMLEGQPFTEWHELRYRKYHRWANDNHPPMAIGEFGPQGTDLVPGPDKPSDIILPGQGTNNPNTVQKLIEYDQELCKDPYMLAAFCFTSAPGDDWKARGYDYDRWIDQIEPLYPTNPTYSLPRGQPTPEESMPTIEQEIAHLKSQNHDLVEALLALREGRLTGAGSVDGWLLSLRGGSLPLDYRPVGPSYPK